MDGSKIRAKTLYRLWHSDGAVRAAPPSAAGDAVGHAVRYEIGGESLRGLEHITGASRQGEAIRAAVVEQQEQLVQKRPPRSAPGGRRRRGCRGPGEGRGDVHAQGSRGPWRIGNRFAEGSPRRSWPRTCGGGRADRAPLPANPSRRGVPPVGGDADANANAKGTLTADPTTLTSTKTAVPRVFSPRRSRGPYEFTNYDYQTDTLSFFPVRARLRSLGFFSFATRRSPRREGRICRIGNRFERGRGRCHLPRS